MIEAKPRAITSVTAYRRASFANNDFMRPSGRFFIYGGEVLLRDLHQNKSVFAKNTSST
nr:MAG TPA: hypothetical protein [Caudoviricetes sp.]